MRPRPPVTAQMLQLVPHKGPASIPADQGAIPARRQLRVERAAAGGGAKSWNRDVWQAGDTAGGREGGARLAAAKVRGRPGQMATNWEERWRRATAVVIR